MRENACTQPAVTQGRRGCSELSFKVGWTPRADQTTPPRSQRFRKVVESGGTQKDGPDDGEDDGLSRALIIRSEHFLMLTVCQPWF